MNLAQKLRSERKKNESVAEIAGHKVFVVHPPVQVVQSVRERAEIVAARSLADVEDELKAKPANKKEFEASVAGLPEDQRPKMPKTLYDQRLESQANQEMLILLAPYMLQDEAGNPVATTEDDRRLVREEVAKDLSLIRAVAEKFKEYGEILAGQVAPDKKK